MKTLLLLTLFVLIRPVCALTIRIDYTYDTTNFFNTQEKRNAIEAVAKFYGDMIDDHLLRIDPAEFPGNSWQATFPHPVTGNTTLITNPVIPADTIIVYVGARDLGGTTRGKGGPGGWGASGFTNWFDRVRARGNPGALGSVAANHTDFAPWGGSIAFDVDSTWNFSQSQNLPGTEFIAVALHEMGHVLGIGTADPWSNQISGNVFSGSAVFDSYESAPPVDSGGGHFADPSGTTLSSPEFGAFGVPHGVSQPVLMRPVLTDNGVTFVIASDLDLAALVDIGWEVVPKPVLKANALGPAVASFTFSTSTFIDYEVQRGNASLAFLPGSGVLIGDGLNQTWTDPSPPAGSGFYRLSATPYYDNSAPAAPEMAAESIAAEKPTNMSEAPRWVECGGE